MYRDARTCSSKGFCKPHRMMLVQGDIKYSLKLPIGEIGARIQTYRSSAADDHSRLLHFDNSSQSITRQVKVSLEKLGIQILHAKPEAAKAKGRLKSSIRSWTRLTVKQSSKILGIWKN
ncbi:MULTISPECIES: hypothetical protein [Blautia]|uniref:hypothetical protein n=1 Tax=Blautia TaxID=572511 RepID=UPI0011C8C5AD|nr:MULTISPECIES: hypothetical protein [Blautia]